MQNYLRCRKKSFPAMLGCALAALPCAAASATSLRVVSYNIDSYDQSSDANITASYAGLPSVIQAIGNHHLGSNAQPVDVLGVEELNTTTLASFVTALNTIYGIGTYKYDTTADPTTGGGTDGLIYNTHTVVSAAAVGTVSGSGASRAPLRYQIRPIGYGPAADFYMYVSHYKAGSDSSSVSRRGVEAAEIRQDAGALGSNAHIIYSGDFNATSAANDPSYTTLTAAGADGAKAYDPTAAGYLSTWTNSSNSWNYLYTESTTTLDARFDFQLVNSATLSQPGVQLATDTSDPLTGNYPSAKYAYAYEVFGNNGTTAEAAAVNATSNTSVNDLANPTAVLNDLKQFDSTGKNFVGSDHYPVVADYNIVGVAPLPIVWAGGKGNWSTAGNWVGGIVPTNPAVEVQIDNGNALASVVTLDQNTSVADVILDANDTFNISSGSTLTLNGPAISTFNGNVNNGGTIITANVSIGSTATFTSTGILKVTGNLTSRGNATFNSDIGAGTYQPVITSLAGTITFAATQHLAALNISSGSLVKLTNTGSRDVIITPSYNIAGTLDLTTNDLDIPAGNLTAFINLVINENIVSISAANDSAHLTTLGVIQNNQGGSALFTAANPLDGTTPGTGDIIVRYTYFGDANLDGKVDGSDYTRIDSGYLSHATTWFDGDFNYDGTVNGSDYTLIDNAFNTQGARLTHQIAAVTDQISTGIGTVPTAVPEPATTALPGIASIVTLGRRRRNR